MIPINRAGTRYGVFATVVPLPPFSSLSFPLKKKVFLLLLWRDLAPSIDDSSPLLPSELLHLLLILFDSRFPFSSRTLLFSLRSPLPRLKLLPFLKGLCLLASLRFQFPVSASLLPLQALSFLNIFFILWLDNSVIFVIHMLLCRPSSFSWPISFEAGHKIV